MNDTVKHICCSIHLFADDTSVYTAVDSPFQSVQLLDIDLQVNLVWAASWNYTFNP